MRAGARLQLAGAALLCLALGLTAQTASAYLSAPASGSATAAVGALAAPTLAAEPGTETVALSWSGVEAPGAGGVTYSVSRDGGDAAGDCSGAGSPGGATACSDSGVSPGAHVYRAIAHWGPWSASSAPVEVEVAAGGAVRLALSVEVTSTAAGVGNRLTVVAEDEAGNPAASYDGTHQVTFSGAGAGPAGDAPTLTDDAGAAVALGTPTALDFEDGIATVAGAANGVLRLYRAETASIVATDGSISTQVALEITVGAAAPQHLAFLDPQATRGTIGSPCLFVCTIEGIGNRGRVSAAIAVTDAFGNVVSDLGAGHSVSVTANAGTVSRNSLYISPSGPAESTRRFTFRPARRGRAPDTVTAATSSGATYADAVATVSR